MVKDMSLVEHRWCLTLKLLNRWYEASIIAQDHFSLQTTGGRICIVTHNMANYKVILSYLSEYNLHHFTFYPQSDKPIKAAICHKISLSPFRSWAMMSSV